MGLQGIKKPLEGQSRGQGLRAGYRSNKRASNQMIKKTHIAIIMALKTRA